MSRREAKSLAIKLANQGLKHEQIAAELAKAGYTSRLGKPLSRAGVSAMLIKSGIRRYSAHSRRKEAVIAAAEPRKARRGGASSCRYAGRCAQDPLSQNGRGRKGRARLSRARRAGRCA